MDEPPLPLYDADAVLAHARTIPKEWYVDARVAARERRTLFGGGWLAVGRIDQVARPGDYFTAEVAGEPIVIVRDDLGTLRGFFNVCRHRAVRVAEGECGHATRFRCRYHGWTYDLAGRLRGVPEFDGVEGFRREDNGLVPLAVEAWGPLLFASLEPTTVELREHLVALEKWRHGLSIPLESLHFVERREYFLDCDWKVFVDNYLDGGYHVNSIHPSLAGVLDYSEYRVELFENCCLQSSPLKPPDPKRDDTSAGAVRSGERAAYWWLFPNFMLNHYGAVMDTNTVWPAGPGRCRVVFDFYFRDVETATDREFIAESIRVAEQIQLEDVGVCAEAQRGLESHAYEPGRFSVRREAGGHLFHRLLARRLGLAAPRSTS